MGITKGKIKISNKAEIRRKGDFQKAPTPTPRDNGAVFKIKIKHK